MKFLIKSALFFLAISMFSCASDDEVIMDDNNNNNNNEITMNGEWSVATVSCMDGVTFTTFDGQSLNGTFSFYGENISSEVNFNDDNTFTSTGTYDQVMSTTFSGNTTTTTNTIAAFSTGGDWSRDGDIITFNNDGSADSTAELIALTETQMEIKVEFNNSETFPTGTSSQTGTVYYNLVRP